MKTKKNMTPIFPQIRLDGMREAARTFNASAPAQTEWNLDHLQREDGAESAFTAMQLTYIRPGVMEIEYPELKGAGLVPVDTSTDSGASTYEVIIQDHAGQVLVSRDYETETPNVDVKTTQVTQGIFGMRLAFSYSLQEARAAIMARVPLNQRKAMNTREEMERKLDDIIFVGDTVSGVKGLLNQTSALTYTIPVGAGGLQSWNSKTPDEILLDLNGPPDKIVNNSLEIEIPDTMVLPNDRRNLIARIRVGDGTSTNILKYFLENTSFIKTVENTHKSNTIGAGATFRGCAYRKDPSKLSAIVSQPFEMLPPQFYGFETKTFCHMRTAGVFLFKPQSVIYFDAI